MAINTNIPLENLVKGDLVKLIGQDCEAAGFLDTIDAGKDYIRLSNSYYFPEETLKGMLFNQNYSFPDDSRKRLEKELERRTPFPETNPKFIFAMFNYLNDFFDRYDGSKKAYRLSDFSFIKAKPHKEVSMTKLDRGLDLKKGDLLVLLDKKDLKMSMGYVFEYSDNRWIDLTFASRLNNIDTYKKAARVGTFYGLQTKDLKKASHFLVYR
jgi:hypothetical protein